MTTLDIATRKDIRLISVISVVHLFSHFYQLTLAPIFPLIKLEMGLTNVELGLLVTVFFIASAVFQTPAGFLVDRFGARVGDYGPAQELWEALMGELWEGLGEL